MRQLLNNVVTEQVYTQQMLIMHVHILKLNLLLEQFGFTYSRFAIYEVNKLKRSRYSNRAVTSVNYFELTENNTNKNDHKY